MNSLIKPLAHHRLTRDLTIYQILQSFETRLLQLTPEPRNGFCDFGRYKGTRDLGEEQELFVEISEFHEVVKHK